MPASVIPVKGLLLGFVGSISNEGFSLRTPRLVRSTDVFPIAFGETLTVNAENSYSSIKTFLAGGGTVTAGMALGIAVSNVNINPTYNSQGSGGINMGGGSFVPGTICDALVQGTINVVCNNGSPVAQGNVYMRVAANAGIPNGVIGGLEAAADGANSILMTNLKWKTGYLENDNCAQVTILARTIA